VSIGKISGPMLQSDLARQGVDLSIDTDVAYFDVANRRVGINNDVPTDTLTVSGNISSTQYYLGNISSQYGANIYISPTGDGMVQIVGTNAFSIPSGNTSQEPSGVPAGSLRYNTEITSPEFYNGNSWVAMTSTVGYQTFSGNSLGNTYPLTQSTTTGGVLVTLNGVQQTPGVAYNVSGNVIVFSEIPLTTDVVDIRYIATGQSGGLSLGAAAPATSTSSGTKGQVAYNSNYIYICVENNTWIRANIQASF
jgi:hypothetical protein